MLSFFHLRPSRLAAPLMLAAACAACSSSSPSTDEPVIVNDADTCDVVVSDADCDDTLRPLVFVHGTFGSGDNFALSAALFGSNGYCQDRIVALEYNSVTIANLSGGGPIDALDALIDEIRTKTGQDQVELLGHSQGTLHCTSYLNDPARAAKVAHYINLSGDVTVANDVKTLSISSNNDLQGTTHHATNAEKTVTLDDEDHMGVASSVRSFSAIYEYLLGKAPKYTEVQCGDDEVTIDGIAETFGDNEPISGGALEVYELGKSAQTRGEPVLTLKSDAKGRATPFKLKRLVPYEIRATDAAGKLVGHVYFAPFRRSNRLARFLAPSANPLVSAITTDRLKRGADHSALVFRNAAGSFRFDLGDSLLLDGTETLSSEVAGTTDTTVGLFMADQNGNQKTDLGASFTAPFVKGTDVYVPTAKPAWVHLDWNGYALRVPNWPSDAGLISVFLM